MAVNTSIPAVPSGLKPDLNQFLGAVKNQIETREGVRGTKDNAFVTHKDMRLSIDSMAAELEKQIPKDTGKTEIDTSVDDEVLRRLTSLEEDVYSIFNSQIMKVDIREGTFFDTYIHVGYTPPSDEGWHPEGCGITAEGIYGVGAEFAHFFLGAKTQDSDLGHISDVLGGQIFEGELRLGNDIAYVDDQTLNGTKWLWYNPTNDLFKMFGGAFQVQNTVDSKTYEVNIDSTGISGYQRIDGGDDIYAFGFTLEDIEHAEFGTLPAGTAYFRGKIIGSSLTVTNDPYEVNIDETGISGFNGSEQVFGFTLEQITGHPTFGTIPAGTAYFSGNIYASLFSGGTVAANKIKIGDEDYDGGHSNYLFARNSDKWVWIDHTGISGFINDTEQVFGFTLEPIYGHPTFGDVPAGSAIFAGKVFQSEIEASTISGTNMTVGSGGDYVYAGELGLAMYNEGKGMAIFCVESGIKWPYSSSPNTLSAGDVVIGDYFGNSGIFYDASAKEMKFAGLTLSMLEGSEDVVTWLDGPEGQGPGLYITSKGLGYWDGTAWMSYISSSGFGKFTGHVSVKNIGEEKSLATPGNVVAVYGEQEKGSKATLSYFGVAGVGEYGVGGYSGTAGGAGVWAAGEGGTWGQSDYVWGAYIETGGAYIGGNTKITGDLEVTGSISGTLDLSGDISAQNITANGWLYTKSDVWLDNSLQVNYGGQYRKGISTSRTILGVDGTPQEPLIIGGVVVEWNESPHLSVDVTLGKSLTVNDNIDVGGKITVNNNSKFNNYLEVGGGVNATYEVSSLNGGFICFNGDKISLGSQSNKFSMTLWDTDGTQRTYTGYIG